MDNKNNNYKDTQDEFNESAHAWLFGEVFAVSVAVGLFTKSWWFFGIVLLITSIMIWIRKMAIILVTALSLMWTSLAFIIGMSIWGWGAAVVLSVLALIISGGFHIGAIEQLKNMNHPNET